MKKKLIIVIVFTIFISFFPFSANAQLVPECGADCDFNDLMELVQNFINFMIVIAIPLAAISFAWAGVLLMTAAGSEDKIKKAHSIFLKVGVGLVFVLTAWLVVYLITSTLLKPDFFLLEGN